MIATYLMSTNLKSVSSMKLHRDLHINQRTAWFLAHRLRVALSEEGGIFSGPVEVDESYFGGRRRNMSNARRKALASTGRGAVGKVAVVGVKDRATKRVAARVVEHTDAATLQGFRHRPHRPPARPSTPTTPARTSPSHSTTIPSSTRSPSTSRATCTPTVSSRCGRCSSGRTWARSTSFPRKHLDRYVQEFASRHNLRDEDTIDIMGAVATGMRGKRLRYRELIADNGLSSGARS